MSTKSTISPEAIKIIKKTTDEAVKKAVEAIIKANKEIDISQRDYFKETERVLYSLPALKLKVAQDEEDIRNGMMRAKERSKDIIRASSGGYRPADYETKNEMYVQERIESMERTKREIQRIERALETIQDDEYYEIIPMKYFDNCTIEEIAERFGKDESTVRRNKNRLINKLKVVLFGADAL